MDGQVRINAGRVDTGADEYFSPTLAYVYLPLNVRDYSPPVGLTEIPH